MDEIAEPQQGTNATSFLKDARKVGVTNAEVQVVCGPDSPAGFFDTHESIMYNPLTFALFVDALQNGGPGNVNRIDLATVCQQFVVPSLGLPGVLQTEGSLLFALALSESTLMRTITEPKIKAYATKKPATCSK